MRGELLLSNMRLFSLAVVASAPSTYHAHWAYFSPTAYELSCYSWLFRRHVHLELDHYSCGPAHPNQSVIESSMHSKWAGPTAHGRKSKSTLSPAHMDAMVKAVGLCVQQCSVLNTTWLAPYSFRSMHMDACRLGTQAT